MVLNMLRLRSIRLCGCSANMFFTKLDAISMI